jgi:mRNA interferase RelE/StbE
VASYSLLIKPSAVKELENLPKKERNRLAGRIQRLALEPRPAGCEKLSGEEKFRVRQGDYRVVYAVDDAKHQVLVVKIGHRKNVYR